jgi:hypothetical protein
LGKGVSKVLVPKKFLDRGVVRRVQKHFPDALHMKAYFALVFDYLKASKDVPKTTGHILQGRREEALNQPVSLLANDLAVFWNFLGDTFKAKLVPSDLVEIPGPENQAWAIWQAAKTLTRVSQRHPGSVILVTLTSLLPRSRRFARILLKMLRTDGDRLVKDLEPAVEVNAEAV